MTIICQFVTACLNVNSYASLNNSGRRMELSEIIALAKKINSGEYQGKELVALIDEYTELVTPILEKYSNDAPEGDEVQLFKDFATEHFAVVDKVSELKDTTSSMIKNTKERAKAMKAYTFVNGVPAGIYKSKKG